MKKLIIIIISTLFFISCGSINGINNCNKKILEKENYLLRVEIDQLKKDINKLQLLFKIDKSFDKIKEK